MTLFNVAGNDVDLLLEDGDMLVGYVVIGLVQRLEGEGEAIVIRSSDGLSYFTRLGLVTEAVDYIKYADQADEDDEQN